MFSHSKAERIIEKREGMAHLRKHLFLNCGAWFSGLVISLIKTPTGRRFPLGQFVLQSPFKFETSMIFHIFWWWLLNGTCWYLRLLLMTGICLEIKQAQVIPRQTDPNSKVHEANMGPTWGRQTCRPYEPCYLGKFPHPQPTSPKQSVWWALMDPHFTIRALPVPEIEALSLTKLHTSGGRRNM